MRKNFYKDFDAKTISEKIIAREDAFAAVDYDSLPFEKKCEYVADYSLFHHPALTDRHFQPTKSEELKPELQLRAEKGDSFALYYLAMLDHSLTPEEQLDLLKRAADAGVASAARAYLIRKLRKGLDEKDYETALSLEDFYYGCLSSDEVYGLKGLITCHRVFDEYWDEELSCADIIYDEYCRLAEAGNFASSHSLVILMKKRLESLTDASEREEVEEELAFWQTVKFLVLDHYASLGVHRHCERLSNMLYDGTGCEVDIDRTIECDVRFLGMMRSGVSPDKLVNVQTEYRGFTPPTDECVELIRAVVADDAGEIRRIVTDAVKSGRRISTVRRAVAELGMARQAEIYG